MEFLIFVLLQIKASPVNDVVTILIGGISALAACIVGMALYIKTLHKEQIKATGKFTEVTGSLNSTIQSQKEAVERNSSLVSDLHKLILDKIR